MYKLGFELGSLAQEKRFLTTLSSCVLSTVGVSKIGYFWEVSDEDEMEKDSKEKSL